MEARLGVGDNPALYGEQVRPVRLLLVILQGAEVGLEVTQDKEPEEEKEGLRRVGGYLYESCITSICFHGFPFGSLSTAEAVKCRWVIDVHENSIAINTGYPSYSHTCL